MRVVQGHLKMNDGLECEGCTGSPEDERWLGV